MRDRDIMLVLAIFLPVHFFLLGKTGLGVAYRLLAVLTFVTLVGVVALIPVWVVGMVKARTWTDEFNSQNADS